MNVLCNIKRKFTWGVSGTLKNFTRMADLSCVFNVLNIHNKNLKDFNSMKIGIVFMENCIRKNVNTANLPPISLKKVYCEMGILDNILYQGKLNFDS